MGAVRVGSLRNQDDWRQAARLMREGQPVGVLGRSVASIWVDPTREAGVAAVYRIKGAKRASMPLGMVLAPDDLSRWVDPQLIAPELRPLLLDGGDLAARLSTIVWIRFPMRRADAARLPACLISTTADGTPWGQGWITDQGDALGALVARLVENGLRLVAPTSMNVSADPEVVNAEAGVECCAQHDIPAYLKDPDDAKAVHGSYPIIQVSRRGMRMVREGTFSGYRFSYLLGGIKVNIDGYRPAKYPLLSTHSVAEATLLSPYQLHDQIQSTLNRPGADREVGVVKLDAASFT